MSKLPKLKNHDNKILFEFYCQKTFTTAREISETFDISRPSANKIVNAVFEFMAREGIESPVKIGNYIPTNLMYDIYGININEVVERLRIEKEI